MAFLYIYTMKFLLGWSFLLLFGLNGFAQEKPLPLDERGKLIYYEVVEMKDVPADSLIARANHFFDIHAKRIKLKSPAADTLLQAEGKMIINKTALVLTRPSGEVKYNFYVGIRDGKYRFWLTDFVFIPYQRDRYGNFVAATTVGTPLENKPGKLNAAEWKGYVNAAGKEAKLLADRFKLTMTGSVSGNAPAKAPERISTKKW